MFRKYRQIYTYIYIYVGYIYNCYTYIYTLHISTLYICHLYISTFNYLDVHIIKKKACQSVN